MSPSPQLGTSTTSSSHSRFIFNASHVARAHTCLAFAAFGVALCVGLSLHYKKIVKNGVAGYPKEWFPSVSSTIGDWYPERNLFQILIALTAGPRIALVCFQYYLHRIFSPTSVLPSIVFASGLGRTLSCGGWVYITSSEDHDIHDVAMIVYVVLNLPWMLGTISCTPVQNTSVRRKRTFVATAFFTSLIPLVYFFIQHKVHRIPGAYTHYSFFEWGLICFDVLFDSIAEEEFRKADLQIALGPSLHNNTTDDIPLKDKAGIQAPVVEGLKAAVATQNGTFYESLIHIFQTWRQPLSFMSDIYLSYIFWSIFTSLIPTLFYFSIWELGIAGHELALFSTLSPVFLSSPSFLSWSRTRGGQTTLQLFSFSGLAAYAWRRPIHRLFIVAFAAIVGVIRQVVAWSCEDVAYQSVVTALGFLLSSLSKHANHSNNPVWPMVNETSGGYNKTGISLALICLLEFFLRSSPAAVQTPNASQPQTSSRHWLTGAIPLGSLVYCLHTYLSDSSTLIAWSWTGYENGVPRGPLPHLHGSITLLVQCVALIAALNTTLSRIFGHPVWFVYGAASSFALLRYRDWMGYAGGLNLAFFLMTIIPHVLGNAAVVSKGAVAKTYFTAMLTYCILALASVWTVAYAFVPGGVYFRERTDLVIIAHMACLSLSFRWPKIPSDAFTVPPAVRSYARAVLAVVSTLSVLVTFYRLPRTVSPQPWRPGPRMFRAGIWTLHFGIDNRGRDSQRRVLNLIRDMELDVVGFLETDLHRIVYGNRDLTRVIIEEMNYYVDLGPGPNSHTWGAVLLSKFPIINSTHHLLPSPHGELAPAISAVLDVFGTPITVVVSHNGQEEDPLDRELQSKELARIMSESPYPTVFLGYVVTKPHAERPAPYKILVEDGRMHDIDDEDKDRWCEYILYRGLYRTSYARVSRSTITDTELQIGQFVLPKYGHTVINDTRESRYLRAYKESLSQDHWFPMAYYGNKRKGGKNGHFYHVFNTPLYYSLPEDAVV